MLTFYSAASLKYHVPDTWYDTTPSHIILTLGRPVLALPHKSECQARSSYYHFLRLWYVAALDRTRDLPFPGADTLPTELSGPVMIRIYTVFHSLCNFGHIMAKPHFSNFRTIIANFWVSKFFEYLCHLIPVFFILDEVRVYVTLSLCLSFLMRYVFMLCSFKYWWRSPPFPDSTSKSPFRYRRVSSVMWTRLQNRKNTVLILSFWTDISGQTM